MEKDTIQTKTLRLINLAQTERPWQMNHGLFLCLFTDCAKLVTMKKDNPKSAKRKTSRTLHANSIKIAQAGLRLLEADPKLRTSEVMQLIFELNGRLSTMVDAAVITRNIS